MRVLIVDDSSVTRRVVERTLRQSGFNLEEVLDAGNGLEALEVLRAPDREGSELNLILTDICMPAMDGLEFVEQMRREHLMPDVPVIMITTEACEADVRRALAAGVAGYIRKPFTADQVQAVVLRVAKAA